MEIIDIIDKGIIDLNLDVTTKDEAIRALSEILKEQGYVNDVELFVEDIYEREKLGMTGIGDSIAIPHGQSKAVLKNGIAIGRTNQPIEWESIDEEPVQYIFLFSVSDDKDYAYTHMKLLSQFAGRLGNSETVKKILEARTTEEIIAVFA